MFLNVFVKGLLETLMCATHTQHCLQFVSWKENHKHGVRPAIRAAENQRWQRAPCQHGEEGGGGGGAAGERQS